MAHKSNYLTIPARIKLRLNEGRSASYEVMIDGWLYYGVFTARENCDEYFHARLNCCVKCLLTFHLSIVRGEMVSNGTKGVFLYEILACDLVSSSCKFFGDNIVAFSNILKTKLSWLCKRCNGYRKCYETDFQSEDARLFVYFTILYE